MTPTPASPCAPRLAVVLLAAAGLAAQVPAPVTAAANAFAKKSAAEQEAVLQRLDERLAAVASPWLRSLRALAAEASAAQQPRTDAFPRRDAGKKAPKADPRTDDGLPHEVDYVFGLGVIQPAAGPAARPEAVRRARCTAALLGALPGIDRAVAVLQQQLDRDAGADRFAAFLESWRNGDESFYEALDRTAGTKDSVFFYDVMLGDFTTAFAKGRLADGKKGLQAAHDALHAAFLAYRQYRAFREAVAWSLALPPDRPLPRHLARYEASAARGYSLRDQVVMMLAHAQFDAAKVAAAVATGAARLPEPLWSADYDPYPRWNEAFVAAQGAMIDAAGSTDEFLARARAAMQQAAEQVKAAVAAADRPAKA